MFPDSEFNLGSTNVGAIVVKVLILLLVLVVLPTVANCIVLVVMKTAISNKQQLYR